MKPLKQLLAVAVLSTALAAVLSLPGGGANAAVIASLGNNPTSSAGDFSNSPGGGAFEDQFTFTLSGALPQHITIASVSNVYPGGPATTDFITNFQAAVYSAGPNGIVNDFDDVVVIGPVAATPGCGLIVNCQFAAGTAILNNGSYYLEFTGVGGGTSGYGGNLSTFAVPGPVVGAGLPGLIMACGGLLAFARRRRSRRVAA